MRCLMGKVQRDRILAALPAGGRMLEWGMGGSTGYFADNLPAGAMLTSIENDGAWFETVRKHIGARPDVSLLHVPAAGPLGANATAAEEDATNLHAYIHGADAVCGEGFDVILVDGYARNACLERAAAMLKVGGTIFLHDAQRSWYDPGKAKLHVLGHIGSCPDYPVANLWWGCPKDDAHVRAHCASRDPATVEARAGRKLAQADYPTIVSFYTLGTPYEEDAKQLIASCRKFGLRYEVLPMPDLGSWERNCAHKARFLLEALQRHRRSILWVDADAVIAREPTLLAEFGMRASASRPDFGIHRIAGWEFMSAAIWLNYTDLTQELLARWVRHCDTNPMVWDQVHLANAWEEMIRDRPLATAWLPESYTKIHDRTMDEPFESPVMEHFQASRRQVGSVRRVKPITPRAQRTAIEASRPRTDAELMGYEGVEGTEGNEGDSASVRGLRARCAQLEADMEHASKARAAMERHVREAAERTAWFQRSALEATARRLSARGITRIALYGAGRHTEQFIRSPWDAHGIEVVHVLDDTPKRAEIAGVRVVRPEACGATVEAVVVSSDAHEAAIFAKAARAFGERGVLVCTVYSGEWAGETVNASRRAGVLSR